MGVKNGRHVGLDLSLFLFRIRLRPLLMVAIDGSDYADGVGFRIGLVTAILGEHAPFGLPPLRPLSLLNH